MPSVPSFESARSRLLADDRVRALVELSERIGVHLVGGAIRDAMLGRPIGDLDLIVERDGADLARRFASARSARLVRLGGDRFAALRIVEPNGTWTDLWDIAGGDLDADLWRRDLTLHAIALDARGGTLRDPTGGMRDLADRRLRATRPAVFSEDPLRALRLVRIALLLPAFTVDPETKAAARIAAPRVRGVAHERVRGELREILGSPDLTRAFALLADLDLLSTLVGHFDADRLDALHDGARRLPAEREVEASTTSSEHGSETSASLAWALLVRLLSRDSGDANRRLEGARDRGYVSRQVGQRAGALVAGCEKPLPESIPAQRLWLHDSGAEWRTALRLRRALGMDRETARLAELELGRSSMTEGELSGILEPPTLLDGTEIAELSGFNPGPELGREIAALRHAQVEGVIEAREAAVMWLETRRAGREVR